MQVVSSQFINIEETFSGKVQLRATGLIYLLTVLAEIVHMSCQNSKKMKINICPYILV